MSHRPSGDPRDEPLPPLPEEAEAWASRERKRREAWLGGPTAFDQEEWAGRRQRRHAFGSEGETPEPAVEEIAQWAERERQRRQAWLVGPTEEEKREWARRQVRRGASGYPPEELPPTAEEIEEWAGKERARRQAWLAGPTDQERRRWMRRQAAGGWHDLADLPFLDTDVVDMAGRLLREADLATKGSVAALTRAPLSIWSYLVRAGRTFEDEIYQPAPRRRVRF